MIYRAQFSVLIQYWWVSYFFCRDVPFSCIYFPLFAYLRLEVCCQLCRFDQMKLNITRLISTYVLMV